MIKSELIKFGLTDKEANVYLGLLQTGTSLVSNISKKAKENRSTTYVLLDSLAEKGLVSISDEGKIRKYTAAPPDRLIHLLEESISKYSDLLHVADSIMPELKNLYKAPKEPVDVGPNIQLFEGLAGIKTVYEDMLKAKGEILMYISNVDKKAMMPKYFPAFYNKLKKKKLTIKAIAPNLSPVRALTSGFSTGKELLVTDRCDDATSEISIYDDKISLISFNSKFGLMIKHEELAKTFRLVFTLSMAGPKD